MFCNVRRTYCNEYVNELEQKLSQRTLRPVPVPSSKKDLMCWKTRFVQLLLAHMKLLALCKSCFVRKITFGGILSYQAFEKRLAKLGEKPLKQNKKKTAGSKARSTLLQKSCQKSKARFMALLCREQE